MGDSKFATYIVHHVIGLNIRGLTASFTVIHAIYKSRLHSIMYTSVVTGCR